MIQFRLLYKELLSKRDLTGYGNPPNSENANPEVKIWTIDLLISEDNKFIILLSIIKYVTYTLCTID